MVVVTQTELAALLRAAGVAPAQTSPLAKLQPAQGNRATAAALIEKGALEPNGQISEAWRSATVTLADPMVSANVHFEGMGAGRYFAGAGGVAGLMAADGGWQVFGGLTVEAILEDAHAALPWRGAPDAPPSRLDLTIAELSVLAAVADAHREEQLLACIERRGLTGGAVHFEIIERMLAWGTERPDHRWLISALNHCAVPGAEPRVGHLEAGARSLIARQLAQADNEVLTLGQDLMTPVTGLAGMAAFMALSVHEPWVEADVKIIIRGVQYFWCVEIGTGASGRARVSRLGGRALEAMLRQYFAPFDQYSAALPQEEAPPFGDAEPVEPQYDDEPDDLPLAAPPPPPVVRTAPRPSTVAAKPPAAKAPTAKAPAAKASAEKCSKCGTALKPGKRFCTKCGTKVA